MSYQAGVTAPMMDTYKRWPVEFVSGAGCRLIDRDGKSYLDLVAGIGVASVGHAHPAVAAAIADQSSRLLHVSNLYETAPQQLLARRLAELTGGMRTFFCNSGAESIECALKLARKSAGPSRSRIVAAAGGFHGRTYGALSATGQGSKSAPFEPLVPEFTHVPFDDPSALEAALGDDVAAVVLEPIQGEAGVIVPDDGYLPAARALCDQAGALLVLDEVQTGLGRTGRWFAFRHSNIAPDILCLAKALGGGLPLGACLATPEVAEAFAPGDHGSTFGGGPVQAAAALAVLDAIEDDGLVQRAASIGATLQAGLRDIFGPEAVRGRGLMIGIAVGRPVAREFASAALERGVLVNDPAPDTLRLLPPLVIGEKDVTEALRTFEEVWDEIGKA
ncbi:MAG TPA: acetylornithine transaminase [Actinomycetota bacterium]|nr:acetylornithine transaminase [Actinomycetota bacterium]